MLSKEQFGQPIRNIFNDLADKFIDLLYTKTSSDLNGFAMLPKEQMDSIAISVRDECMQQVQSAFYKTINNLKEANNGR